MEHKNDADPLAISEYDFREWGCPSCGCLTGSLPVRHDDSMIFSCGSCRRACVILAAGTEKSSLALGPDLSIYPLRSPHPRAGIPAHGAPEHGDPNSPTRFIPEGIRNANAPICFVCSASPMLGNCLIGRTQTDADTCRIVAMVGTGARIRPDAIPAQHARVEIGACNTHEQNLAMLEYLIGADETITEKKIERAKQ